MDIQRTLCNLKDYCNQLKTFLEIVNFPITSEIYVTSEVSPNKFLFNTTAKLLSDKYIYWLQNIEDWVEIMFHCEVIVIYGFNSVSCN